MSAKENVIRALWRWGAPVLGLAAIAFAVYFYYHAPREKSYRLRVTAGNAYDTRHQIAHLLQSEAAPHALQLEVQETAGSEEALEKVNTHLLDLALIQGGLSCNDCPQVRQVATLQVEPMHLLVKKELAQEVTQHLAALAGKTVNLGKAGSGSHTLAVEILAFAGLQPRGPDRPGGYIPMARSGHELLEESDRARLPDAVFGVVPLPSRVAKSLVSKHDYRLVPLPFGEAFALNSLGEAEARAVGLTEGYRVDKGRIYATTIPAFTYSLDPPVPAVPLPSLGARMLLVAHKDVDTQAVRRLVEVAYTSEFTKVAHPPLDAKLLEPAPEFPWHDGTRLYLQRNQPLLSGPLLDSFHKGFAILAAAASGLFVLWQWSKQRSQFTRDRGFTKYIDQVTRIEEQAMRVERGQPTALPHLLALRDELGRLKTEALDRFTQGELAGKELLSSFLVQANEARAYVTRLLLRQDAKLREHNGREAEPGSGSEALGGTSH
jgi:TRAP-type uncharacterized transport system substrate-binding protein